MLQRLTCNLYRLVSPPEIVVLFFSYPASQCPRNGAAPFRKRSASAGRGGDANHLAVIARQRALPLRLRSKPNFLSTSTAEHSLKAKIRTPKETHTR